MYLNVLFKSHTSTGISAKLSVRIELFLDQIISCGCSINALVRCVFFSILVQKQIINFPYEFNQPIFCNASIVFQAISVIANSNIVLLNSNQSGEEKQNVSFSIKYCFFSVHKLIFGEIVRWP